MKNVLVAFDDDMLEQMDKRLEHELAKHNATKKLTKAQEAEAHAILAKKGLAAANAYLRGLRSPRPTRVYFIREAVKKALGVK